VRTHSSILSLIPSTSSSCILPSIRSLMLLLLLLGLQFSLSLCFRLQILFPPRQRRQSVLFNRRGRRRRSFRRLRLIDRRGRSSGSRRSTIGQRSRRLSSRSWSGVWRTRFRSWRKKGARCQYESRGGLELGRETVGREVITYSLMKLASPNPLSFPSSINPVVSISICKVPPLDPFDPFTTSPAAVPWGNSIPAKRDSSSEFKW